MNIILERFLKLIIMTLLIHLLYRDKGLADVDSEMFKDISNKLDFIINFLKKSINGSLST